MYKERTRRGTPHRAGLPRRRALLDVAGSCIVGVQSCPNRPAEMRAFFPGKSGGGRQWVPLAPPAEPLPAAVETALAGMSWRIIDVAAPGKTTAGPAEARLARAA